MGSNGSEEDGSRWISETHGSQEAGYNQQREGGEWARRMDPEAWNKADRLIRLVITYHKLMISCDKTHWWWFEHQIYRHEHDVLTNSATLPTLE